MALNLFREIVIMEPATFRARKGSWDNRAPLRVQEQVPPGSFSSRSPGRVPRFRGAPGGSPFQHVRITVDPPGARRTSTGRPRRAPCRQLGASGSGLSGFLRRTGRPALPAEPIFSSPFRL